MREFNLMPQTNFLVKAAQQGDVIALNQLVKQWQKRIYNFAFKYFGDYDQAMEVTQKTFISMSKNLGSLKDESSFKPWIYRIASNYCHEEIRRQNRKWVFPFLKVQTKDDQRTIADTFSDSKSDNPEKSFGNKELKNVLTKALATLPEEQRMVVIMKEYEGLKIREIAEVMDISENTVKSRLYYALGSLRKLLEEWNITKETVHYEL
ncbi:RNA polymerase sigma factor [Roseivirga thermotolerans]|uniref:RNA polymerase sigma factor n=1 Tax=Roseivirga thermotolerans TaxID=1758176 RepID=A0ABQ3IAW6_9BACT|nr:sigma-70 family RNA polymerase sigma factor [Roseivirga thermotolerans]GHE70373.1 RNA polymerase sigma factor [Roseivirga thermotolerans]